MMPTRFELENHRNYTNVHTQDSKHVSGNWLGSRAHAHIRPTPHGSVTPRPDCPKNTLFKAHMEVNAKVGGNVQKPCHS